MKIQRQFSSDLITLYRNYFLGIAFSGYFIKETKMSFRAVEFDMGIILELYLRANKDTHIFDTLSGQPVPKFCVTSIFEAFDELQINISDFLTAKHNEDLIKAVRQAKSYFIGTVRFYDEENDKIYFIKEKKKEQWTKEAAQSDIERVVEEIKYFSSNPVSI